MKKYTLVISGYGAEVTIGTLTPTEVDIIKSEVAKETTLTTIVWEEMLNKSFYDMDDIYHNWGCGDVFHISVFDEENNVVFECNEEMVHSESEIFQFQDKFIDSDEPMIMSVSGEKGVFFETTLELEQFDISKLKIMIDSEVGIPNYYYGDMISKIFYDGEELDNIGGSTDGKFFESGTNIEFETKLQTSQVLSCGSYLQYLSKNLDELSKFCEQHQLATDSTNLAAEKIANSIDELISELEKLGFTIDEIYKTKK